MAQPIKEIGRETITIDALNLGPTVWPAESTFISICHFHSFCFLLVYPTNRPPSSLLAGGTGALVRIYLCVESIQHCKFLFLDRLPQFIYKGTEVNLCPGLYLKLGLSDIADESISGHYGFIKLVVPMYYP